MQDEDGQFNLVIIQDVEIAYSSLPNETNSKMCQMKAAEMLRRGRWNAPSKASSCISRSFNVQVLWRGNETYQHINDITENPTK